MNKKQLKKVGQRYPLSCLVAALATLGLAFWSKYYTGPFEKFADAYLGDVFIVMCLYFTLAVVQPWLSVWKTLLVIAAVACFVELLQLSGWPAALNLPEPFVFILGTSFDPKDFLYYVVGLSLAGLLDIYICRLFRENHEELSR